MNGTTLLTSSTIFNEEDDTLETTEWWIPALIFGVFTGICGYTIIFLSLHANYLSLRIRYRGIKTSAVIVSKRIKTADDDTIAKIYKIEYKYTINDIERVCKTRVSSTEYSKYYINQQIDINYDGDNPLNTDIYNERDMNDKFWWCPCVISLICSFSFGIGVIIGCSYGSAVTAHKHQTIEAVIGTLLFGIIIATPYCLYKCYKTNTFCCCCCMQNTQNQSKENEVNIVQNIDLEEANIAGKNDKNVDENEEDKAEMDTIQNMNVYNEEDRNNDKDKGVGNETEGGNKIEMNKNMENKDESENIKEDESAEYSLSI